MQALVLMRLGEEDINEWAGLLQKKKKKRQCNNLATQKIGVYIIHVYILITYT